ncbi:CARDB domain-containing protein [Tissierella sp. Yu-01]|uniref:COG1361 S-layer family protein n=1 Tax=Tissierella sp. Yu-01 TaxID=3035694 RepID=UPI00240E74D3|nr:CARDB domain-containing protein [Tissierella sp. Yu-01]WFA08672.1 CARDB domain-containing protein [Tissierella sp. Yu-01]
MKRALSILIIFTMMITIIPITSFAQGGLIITSNKTITATSGESVRIPVTIENFNYNDIYDITVSADISDPDYVYLTDSSSEYIEYIEYGDSEKVTFKAKVDDLAPRGTYKVDITLRYDGGTQSETVYIRVDSNPPRLSISRVDILPEKEVHPGQKFNVGIELENLGDVTANDITVSLEGLNESGISLANGSSTQRIQSIRGGSKNYAAFQLEASKSLKKGSHQIKLKLKYNENMEETQDITINVETDRNATSNLIFENLTFPTGTMNQNQEVNVSFDLKNQGQSEATNIIVKANSNDINGLVPKSLSQLKIDSIAPGEIQTVEFQFLTTKSSETRNYPIDISVEYEDDLIAPGEKYNINQFVGVFVEAPDEDANQSTPKLIIDKYNFEPSLVKAGDNFTMNLSFYNTNGTKAVKNIKIFLTSDEKTDNESNSAGGSVFTPVDSSNTFYIDSIPPKGRVEKKITMFTVPDAQAKTYTLTANFEYEDSEANQYTATELIGVPVIQQSKLDIGEIGFFPEAYVGQSSPISLEFYNTGKVTLYNMMVKLEGDFQTENGQYYIGNFNSGSSEYFEGYVIPSAPGELKGNVVFTYEDSTGQIQEVREEFTLNVMDMMEPEFPGEMPPIDEMPNEGSNTGKIIGGIITVIAVIAGIVIYKKKKLKKLEAMEIDE